MSKKIIILIALLCILVPFVFAGFSASAEVLYSAPSPIVNTTIRIVGINFYDCEDVWVVANDFSTGDSERYSFEGGDFYFPQSNVAEISFEVDLISGDTWLFFGVMTSNGDVYYLTGASYIIGNDSYSYGIQPYVNAFRINTMYLDDFDYLICHFSLADVSGAYNNGYDAGYQAGESAGYQSGVSFADNNVNTNSASYQAGYQAGLDVPEYSFTTLISAVLDAPIRALFGFTDADGVLHPGLFNVEFLGINMASFILSLFTFAIVITVIRLILGGK